MPFRLIAAQVLLLLVLSGCSTTVVLDTHRAKFAVVAMSDSPDGRIEVENAISDKLQDNDLDAVASHRLVSREFRVQDAGFRNQLLKNGIIAVLVLRPIAVGPDASIESARDYVQEDVYQTVADFVADYRGGRFATEGIVEVGGFRLLPNRAVKIWQGVIWLDGSANSREEGIEQLANLILTNVQKQRDQLRAAAGLPPL